MTATRLRVVTWNIRAAIGPGPFPDRWWRRIDADRLRAIGSVIASLDADIVALQEVAVVSCDGELVDTPGDLARQTGMELRYAAVRAFDVDEPVGDGGIGMFGNALLSRLPIRAARCVRLPAAPTDALVEPPGALDPLTGAPHPAAGVRYADAPASIREPRCLLVADVAGIRVASTHFSHVGSSERRLQADATIAALDDAARAVLLGDLNAPIEAAELAPFAGWVDAFAEPPGHAGRISTDDGMRIDHVLVRGVDAAPARVVREAGGLSDHLPVIADVRAP